MTRAQAAARRAPGSRRASGAGDGVGAANATASVQYAVARTGLPAATTVRRYVRAAALRDLAVTVRFVGAREGRTLNARFRGKDHATNVLTFVYDNAECAAQTLAGDIVLCAPVIEREASQQHKMSIAHYAHLTVHGVLHLQGYDHESEVDAAEMERLETHIVEKLGYKDPYSEFAE